MFTKNNQKTSFRYFKWTLQEVSIGKLITISFFSGLLISTYLNSTIINYRNNNSKDIDDSYEPLDSTDDVKSNIEMPPQRDIRDAQPTISVNYRVVKNAEEDYLKSNQNESNYSDNRDDWNDVDNDW